jgi:hypothetical protein
VAVSGREYYTIKSEAQATTQFDEGVVVGGSPMGGPSPLTSDVTASFVGLDRPGSTDQGVVYFPPDTNVAKSRFRVLEATNAALRLFTNAGGVLATKPLTTFFGASAANGRVFDPKVYYDRLGANPRLLVVALQKGGTTVSRIWLGISRSPDPVNLEPANWCRYNIDGRRNNGTVNASWADYPSIGAANDAFAIGTNQFRFSNDTFTFNVQRVFRKVAAYNNAAGCPVITMFTFQPTGVIGTGAVFTVNPVQHYLPPSSFVGTTNPLYFVSTHFGTDNRYRVWRVRNVAGAPTMQGPVDVAGGFVYGVPPDAPQAGTAVMIDTGDNRVTQAAGIGNSLVAVHGTGCNFGGGANESCARYARISVGQSGAGALTAAIFGSPETATFGFTNEFYFWPGVAVNTVFQSIIPFQFVSSALTGGRLSAWFAVKQSGVLPASIIPLTTGSCAQTLSNRSGDYVGAAVDPSTHRRFWIAGERATTIAGLCQWQTQVGEVDPGWRR